MMAARQQGAALDLRSGPSWLSFEKFRTEGAKALEPVKDGTVATLQTKTGQYRILSEGDFQTLYGLASDVERLRGGMRVVLSAARAVQKHKDSDSVEVLLESVRLLGSLPELPTREAFEELQPESFNSELDEDDEVITDPALLERPI